MSGIDIVEDIFGVWPDPGNPSEIKRFTISNQSGFSAQVISYGATLTSLKVPNKAGQIDDVVLGFDNIEGYAGLTESENPYFGASIGRSSNRIARGRFTLDGVEYQLSINNGVNHLHGGVRGFDKRLWTASVNGPSVTFSYLSQDGEEGYPGEVLAQVTYEVTTDNELIIRYQALATKPCPVAFTNHSYFNLAGHNNADSQLNGHFIRINADLYTPVDEDLIITGEILPIASTIYDLRTSTNLHEVLQQFPEGPNGFDNNYCLNLSPGSELNFAARVEETGSGRVMEILTDKPGLQFYTSNQISETVPIIGKNGARYFKHGAFVLETQNYPDAVNHANFPTAILRPGSQYTHTAVFKFSTLA